MKLDQASVFRWGSSESPSNMVDVPCDVDVNTDSELTKTRIRLRISAAGGGQTELLLCIPASDWQKLIPRLAEQFPRLAEQFPSELAATLADSTAIAVRLLQGKNE